MLRLLILPLILFGCTTDTSPDEFSLHYFYGEGDISGNDVGSIREKPRFSRFDGDTDNWILGATLTWYLPQPPKPGIHGHDHSK